MNEQDSSSLDLFQTPVRDELETLESNFRQILRSDIPIIDEICTAMAEAPGKRIRPSILFLAARASGGRPEASETAGLAIELVHTATLLHDDIIDGHETRRGRPTVYAKWGSEAATIMGDFLYSKAFSCLGDAGLSGIMEVLSRVTNLMSIGEMIQLEHRRNIDVNEDGYMELIYRKTASLFSASSECGAMLGESSNGYRRHLSSFGRDIGLAFQITDDLFDYIAVDGSIGKPVASDFSEGRVTLPFITAFRNAPDMKRRRVSELFHNGFDRRRHWPEVVSFVRDYGGVEYCFRRARELGESAKDSLGSLSPSMERDALCSAADYVVDRVFPFTA